jgi:hypothetical protein
MATQQTTVQPHGKGTVAKNRAKKRSPETEEASEGIKCDSELSSTTSPDYPLAFVPVVSLSEMTAVQLGRLQDVQRRVLDKSKGWSGSVHLNPHLKKHPDLQEVVILVVSDIILELWQKTMVCGAGPPTHQQRHPGQSLSSWIGTPSVAYLAESWFTGDV